MTVTILDGGMGQELVKRSGKEPTPLWSTRVMLDNPGLVAEIHTDYFNAGAEVATANTYAILRNRLAFEDLQDRFGDVLKLSITVDDEDGTRFRSGEAVADLAPILEPFPPEAVLVNCSAPEAISQAMPVLKALGLPFGGNANGFVEITKAFLGEKPTVDALRAREDVTPQRYADFVAGWIEAGATLVGGCCEVGPAHIAELKRRFG